MRVGSVAYRWAGVCGSSLGHVVGVGVRCDDEDRAIGESLVVSVLPGKIVARQTLHCAVRAVGGDPDGVLVLCERGRVSLLTQGPPHELRTDVRQLVGHVICTNDGEGLQWRDGAFVSVASGCVAVGEGDHGGAVVVARAGDEHVISGFDRDGARRFSLSVAGLGEVRAVAHDGDVVVVASVGAVFVIERATGEKRRLSCGVDVDAVSVVGPRALFGSVGGLYALDLDDDAVRAFRPSLRAHQLHRTDDGVAIVSDLFIGSSDDGVDVTSRDLSGLIRVFEKGSSEGAAVKR